MRLRNDERTQACAARRRAEGKTDRETPRCPKRRIAREIHRLLADPPQVPHGQNLRQQRIRADLVLDETAEALDTSTSNISALERRQHHDRHLAERCQQHLTETAA